jgi:hypothetical protein
VAEIWAAPPVRNGIHSAMQRYDTETAVTLPTPAMTARHPALGHRADLLQHRGVVGAVTIGRGDLAQRCRFRPHKPTEDLEVHSPAAQRPLELRDLIVPSSRKWLVRSGLRGSRRPVPLSQGPSVVPSWIWDSGPRNDQVVVPGVRFRICNVGIFASVVRQEPDFPVLRCWVLIRKVVTRLTDNEP